METNFTPKTIVELGIRLTSPEGSYWNHNGAYQTEGDELFEKMVPASGAAATLNGELIRGINRLFHEYCNNGNCNALEIEEFDDDEDVFNVPNIRISPFYAKFLSLISGTLRKRILYKEVDAVINQVRNIIFDARYDQSLSVYFSKENVNVYSRMCDLVIWYVLNTPDSKLPADYDRN